MIHERDIWAAAILLLKRHGKSSGEIAFARVAMFKATGNREGVVTWSRIGEAARQLLRERPEGSEPVH
jgi:hypothetical protein